MMLAREVAREFIRKQYPGMKFRLTKQTTIGVRPVFEVELGMPVLVWRKHPANGCVICIGQLLPGNTIDWTYKPQ